MKRITYLFLALALSSTQLPSCKSKKAAPPAETTTPSTAPQTETAAPPVIAADDELTSGVKDATKDFPTVTAAVNNGEITLTGSVTRDRLPTLMQSLNSLHPKKVNNNLIIK